MHPALLGSSAAGLLGVLLADALVGEVAGLVGLLVVLAAGLLVGQLLGLVQRLIAALLALLTVERVLRLVRESSGIHAGLLPSECATPRGYPTRPAVTPLPSPRHASDLPSRPGRRAPACNGEGPRPSTVGMRVRRARGSSDPLEQVAAAGPGPLPALRVDLPTGPRARACAQQVM